MLADIGCVGDTALVFPVVGPGGHLMNVFYEKAECTNPSLYFPEPHNEAPRGGRPATHPRLLRAL